MTVHEAFGLTRASYFVIPRLVLESMPEGWQERFVDLVNEAHERFVFDERPYDVRLRGRDGRFEHDPLSEYRHGRAVPR